MLGEGKCHAYYRGVLVTHMTVQVPGLWLSGESPSLA